MLMRQETRCQALPQAPRRLPVVSGNSVLMDLEADRVGVGRQEVWAEVVALAFGEGHVESVGEQVGQHLGRVGARAVGGGDSHLGVFLRQR
jgi:hypothetical protein